MIKQAILIIQGRVQGVFFRDSARRRAKKLGLTGWVSNQEDGTVKVVAEGEQGDLEKLIKWCYNGPIIAKVDKIDIKWQEATGQFNSFEIKYE
jgi:acylphosphatase